MTAQWQHQYITKTGETIRSEDSPFDPQRYGLLPGGGHCTACRRGYVCEFIVEGQQCILNKLMIRLKPLLMDQISGTRVPFEEYPKLNGQYPSSLLRNFVLYENIGLEFTFTPSPTYELAIGGRRFRYSPSNPFEKKEEHPRKWDNKAKHPPANHSNFQRNQISAYDIIGDIHGNADALKRLLKERGYDNDGSSAFKNRRLIFLGDFIDRGEKNKEVIEIIRKLVRTDKALAVMGNHEYNAICYHTKNKDGGGKYLRKHDQKNKSQHIEFLKEYQDDDERNRVINWFQRLPFFLDLGDFRIVHACWDQETINFVKTKYGNYLTDDFLQKSVDENTPEYNAIETLLKGPEASLRDGLSFQDSDNNERTAFRVKWWKDKLITLGDAAILPQGSLTEYLDDDLSLHCGDQDIKPYSPDAPPVFFGHYAALPVEESFTDNTACLDYNVIAENGTLACLCWKKKNKDKVPSEMRIVTVLC